MLGGQSLEFSGDSVRPHTDVWLSIAQAFFPSAASPLEPLQQEQFVQDTGRFSEPIARLWVKPA